MWQGLRNIGQYGKDFHQSLASGRRGDVHAALLEDQPSASSSGGRQPDPPQTQAGVEAPDIEAGPHPDAPGLAAADRRPSGGPEIDADAADALEQAPGPGADVPGEGAAPGAVPAAPAQVTAGRLSPASALLRTSIAGLLGGAVLGAEAFGRHTQFHTELPKLVTDAFAFCQGLITQKAGAAAAIVGRSLLPTVLGAGGEIASYRIAAVWGRLSGVPAAGRSWFAHWQPGSRWPDDCAPSLPPASPPPSWCPDFTLATVQRNVMPSTIAGTYALWGAVGGLALGAAVFYTPLGRQLAATPWLHHGTTIAAVTGTVGYLVLYPAALATQI